MPSAPGPVLYASPSRSNTPTSFGRISTRPRAVSSATLKRTRRLAQLRSLYSNAARAFLLRDYSTTAAFLEDGESVEGGDRTAWITALVEGSESMEQLELMRKLEILRITFIATVYDSTVVSEEQAQGSRSVNALLTLPPTLLIAQLWAQAIGQPPSSPLSGDIFPSVEAATLHPSIAIALTLAALKLNVPRSAKAVASSWFSSISEPLDNLLYTTSATIDVVALFGIEESGMSMSTSGLREKLPPRKAVVGSWLRLLDLLTLHVLPKLGEWEEAEDFVRAQKEENGGWVPDVRVEASIGQLHTLQIEESQQIHSRILRQQRDLESSRLLQTQAQQQQREKERRRSDKGKGRALNGDMPLSPPQGVQRIPSMPNGAPVAPRTNSFALLRTTLSTYLARSTPPSALSSDELLPLSLSTLPAYLRHYYLASTLDPVKLLSVVLFVFAFTNWMRGRLLARLARVRDGSSISVSASMREGLVLVLSRLGQTVKMGTAVSSL